MRATAMEAKSPTKAGKLFHAATDRLLMAQKQNACLFNCFETRSRSGFFQLLTYEVAKHPITQSGYDGVVVQEYVMFLSRKGRISAGSDKLAFVSWHALGRMYERADIEQYGAHGIVAYCGIAGLLMRESKKHLNTAINLAFEGIVCVGTLRFAQGNETEKGFGFYDVITVLQHSEKLAAQLNQGNLITHMVVEYIEGDDASPRSRADKIPVLPFREADYVSRELR
jgi:hypothetical protein